MPSPRTTVSAGRNRDPQATSHQLRALTRSPVWTYALTWGLGHRGAPPPSRKRAAGVAFDLLDGLGTPNDGIFGARCPAHAHLYRRFACLLAKADARLKARMVRQSFPSPDFHRLSTTKLGWRSQDLPLLPSKPTKPMSAASGLAESAAVALRTKPSSSGCWSAAATSWQLSFRTSASGRCSRSLPRTSRRAAHSPLARVVQGNPRHVDLHHLAVQRRCLPILGKQRHLPRPGLAPHNLDRAAPRRALAVVDLAEIQNLALNHPAAAHPVLLHLAPVAVHRTVLEDVGLSHHKEAALVRGNAQLIEERLGGWSSRVKVSLSGSSRSRQNHKRIGLNRKPPGAVHMRIVQPFDVSATTASGAKASMSLTASITTGRLAAKAVSSAPGMSADFSTRMPSAPMASAMEAKLTSL